jgi:hypothetical protein
MKRSEADIHDGLGVSCATGGSAQHALDWAAGTGAGVADEACEPYPFGDENCNPCSDRSGRTLKLPTAYTFNWNSNIQDQKTWIYNVGPITADFDVIQILIPGLRQKVSIGGTECQRSEDDM